MLLYLAWGSPVQIFYPWQRSKGVYSALIMLHCFPPSNLSVTILSLLGDKYSDEYNVLVPPVQTFPARTHHSIYTGSNHHRSLRTKLVSKKKLCLDSFILWAAVLLNRLPRWCFPYHYNFKFFMSNVECQLLSLLHILITCNCYVHKTTTFSYRLLWVALTSCMGVGDNSVKNVSIRIG